MTKDEIHFLLRRLHSLTGIVPTGGFLLFHFFENASARHGPEAFNETVVKISSMPYLYWIEIFALLLPILFHAVYGIFITSSSRPELSHKYERNFAYIMQRVTGMVAVFFIGYHVATTRVWALFDKGDHFTFADMQANLAPTWVVVFYVIGILSACYHFTNGVWSFSITWGIIRSRAAQERLARITSLAFVVLSVVGLDILSAFIRKESILASIWTWMVG
jgi:succinate dehydrogenase / fumarate reductase cytochrome b subunit